MKIPGRARPRSVPPRRAARVKYMLATVTAFGLAALTFAASGPADAAVSHLDRAGLGSVTSVPAGTTASKLTPPSPRHVAGMPGTVTRTYVDTTPSPSGATCADYYFPVTMSRLDTQVFRVWGRLCSKTSFGGRPVQILLHGGGYNHNYWDFPYEPGKYSYVRAATSAGFVTLDLDRLGYGYSSHPLSALITFGSDAWVAHQIVQYMRRGALGTYSKFELVGHSMGGFTTYIEAGTYHDVDAIIVTDADHVMNYAAIATLAPLLEPAELDPKFAGKIPVGYLYTTTEPNTRCGSVLYHQGGFDPGVCKVDEETKDTITAGEWATLVPATLSPIPTLDINVPVLVGLGQYDAMMCMTECGAPGDNSQLERKYYAGAPSFDMYIEPDSGHDMNLHKNAPEWFRYANSWSWAHL